MKADDFIRQPSALRQALRSIPTVASGQDEPFILSLADGTRLALRAGDETAARVVGFLARAAQLFPAPVPLPPGVRCLLVVTDVGRAARGMRRGPPAPGGGGAWGWCGPWGGGGGAGPPRPT